MILQNLKISRMFVKKTAMGKGDMKTKRGKIHRGSYGKRRPRNVVKSAPVITETKEKKVAKPKVKPAEPAVEEPKAKKAPAKPKAKKETTDQASLFDGENTAKTE